MNRRIREFFRSWNSQDEDTRNATLLIAGISLVIIIALGIVGYGYIEYRSTQKDTVMVVNSKDVEYEYLQKRLGQFMNGDGTLSPEQFSSLLGAIIAQIEQEELMRYLGKERGITVSDQELDAEMHEDLSVATDAAKEVYATALRRELLTTGLSLKEYEETQRAQVIEDKIRDQAQKAVPSEAEQVNIRLVQTATKENADLAKAKFDAGEPLGAVAGTYSTHSSANKGGEVGWVVRNSFNSKLEDAMFSQAVGTTSGIIETDEGFYMVEVRGKETRPVTEDLRQNVGNRAFNVAIKEARDSVGSELRLTNGQVNRLANHFRSSLNTGG